MIESEPNGVRHWLHALIEPQTILWGAVALASIVTAWITINTRIAVLEAAQTVQLGLLQRQVDELRANAKSDLAAAVADRNERLRLVKQEADEADNRLWNDITDLRRQLMQNTYNIGQANGEKMTARKKPPRVPSARITDTWHKRPWLTLSTVGGAVAILSTIGPAIVWGLHYYATHDEFAAHQLHDANRDAWQTVQMIRLETLAQRNRVNDCAIAKAAAKPMTALERDACATYQNEFDAATKRLEKAQAEAMETTKEKQGANQ